MNKLDVINNILKNKKFFLYHGTTRCFENHEIKRARTILNNDFQGDWICYTDNINVAWKYAGANRNQNIDNILFFEELNGVLNKINKNHKIIPFIINLSKNFEKFNYTDSWDLAIKESKMEKKEIFDNLDNFFSKIKNLDINDYCDILKELEYTNQEKENDFFDIFKSKSDSFSIYIIESMRKMGFQQ